jgi:hypothetical protein
LKVPGPTTTVATLDVDRQNVPALAIEARFPNIAFQTTMVAKICVAARETSIFLAFKMLSYVSQVIGHECDTIPRFRSRLGHYLWNATLMPFSSPQAEMPSLTSFLRPPLGLGTGLAFSLQNRN